MDFDANELGGVSGGGFAHIRASVKEGTAVVGRRRLPL